MSEKASHSGVDAQIQRLHRQSLDLIDLKIAMLRERKIACES